MNPRTWAYPATGMAERARRRIPEATVARLPVYVRILLEVAESRTATISSERLAELAGVNAAKVRKDLSYLGSYGTRGVGYDVEYLLFQMSRELGLTHDWPVVIVGAGTRGQERFATGAQEVADRLVAAGVTSILNFAPAVLTVPRGVSLRKVDLAVELQILSFYQQRRGGDRIASA